MGEKELTLFTLEHKMTSLEKTIKKTEKVMAAFDVVKGELEVTKAYNKELERVVKLQKLVITCSLSALLISILFIYFLIIT